MQASPPLKLTVKYERWILEKGIKIGVEQEFLRTELDAEQGIKVIAATVDAAVAEALKENLVHVAEEAAKNTPTSSQATSQKTVGVDVPPDQDFENLKWYVGSGEGKRPAKKGEAGWGFAWPDENYNSAVVCRLAEQLRLRVDQAPNRVARVWMGGREGALFDVAASGKDSPPRYLKRSVVKQ
jgi:hypothetical protein